MNKKLKRILITVSVVLVLMVTVVPFSAGAVVCEVIFGTRYETDAIYAYDVEDFQGLMRVKHQFVSDKGQTLVGYLYYAENVEYRGVVIIAHGFGGGGHRSYMECADYFAKNGYYAFAYDATGNDESGGKKVYGLPQGIIDLNYAITYVEGVEELKDLPIMLFGHSWGGYSVLNALAYHPEVKAAVSMSGFDKGTDFMESHGTDYVGEWSGIFVPYLQLYENIKFGEYATCSALDAFEKSNSSVMVIHSQSDKVVSAEHGYDLWYEKYSADPRFEFIELNERDHGQIYYSQDAIIWENELFESFEQWKTTLDYDFEKETERFETDKAAWIKENVDREKFCSRLDKELFSEIIKFYDESIK